jgi:membrane-associated protease RseP (regulator of RpoE activity)
MNQAASLRFQLFNFPVRVRITFFLIALLLGLRLNNPLYLLFWVLIVFVSVLLHELGHAIAADHYGRAPQIELYEMGGLTISTRYSLLSYPKEILISFAGPLAGFLFGGLLYLLVRFLGPIQNNILAFVIGQLLWVNIGWGIINLIPILPLDGGSIMRNLYHWLKNPYDERTPLMISIGFGILLIVACLFLREWYLAILVGFLTFNNYQALTRGGYPGRM